MKHAHKINFNNPIQLNSSFAICCNYALVYSNEHTKFPGIPILANLKLMLGYIDIEPSSLSKRVGRINFGWANAIKPVLT